MSKFIISISIVLINALLLFEFTSASKDYIWENFDGHMPEDALLAGADRRGHIYIGQVLVFGQLIPGKMYQNDPNIYYEYGGRAMKANQNIKILRTRHPDKFSWVATAFNDYRSATNMYLVTGGYSPGYNVHIGRVLSDNGEANIGNVVCHHSSCTASFPLSSGGAVEYPFYEILTYNHNMYKK